MYKVINHRRSVTLGQGTDRQMDRLVVEKIIWNTLTISKERKTQNVPNLLKFPRNHKHIETISNTL